jgi:hypothetical protein
MDKVIRYEEGFGALPPTITIKARECRSFPQAVKEQDREMCNRNMFGYDLTVHVREAPREMAESIDFVRSFADSMKARGITSPYQLSADEMSSLAYHKTRAAKAEEGILAMLPFWDRTQGGQRPRTLFTKPR